MDIETIVIDEDFSQKTGSENNNDHNFQSKTRGYGSIPGLRRIKNADQLFTKFLEKCLDLENSEGMLHIINNIVIKAYEETEETYRKSSAYARVLEKALHRLEVDPEHKFSQLKDMVETLKLHRKKKRVKLITLASNLSEHGTNQKRPPKRRRLDSIVLDSEDEDIPVINLDEEQNDVIVLEDGKENINSEMENVTSENGHQEDSYLEPQIEVAYDPTIPDHSISSQEMIEDGNDSGIDMDKVKQIENEIANCKKIITHYEEAEVDDDSLSSPYVLCERYKTKIVTLYKQLCELIGHQPKKRQIRLQVLEGHPPGPVRRLQSFINENIGDNGIMPFPDFCDVVKCVMVANVEDKLEFTKQQVMNEANALFVQCGHALQKQRQRREYRDLLAKVKLEALEDHDPAAEDPQLLARLEENRRVAAKKEKDLLERYVMLQNQPPQKHKPVEPSENPSSQPSRIEDDDSDNSNFEYPEVYMISAPDYMEINNPGPSQTNQPEDCNVIAKIEPEEKIKSEPVDFVKMLDDLGDVGEVKMSIIDIEDPFLVIEISSDSSDDEVM